jgi:thiol-disulfide isomerase/thioredoxin
MSKFTKRHLLLTALSLMAAPALMPTMALAQAAPDAPMAKPAAKPAAEAKLKVGDKAPAIEVEKWIKGDPVTGFEPGKAYIVEFWATWCGPCIRAFPHLSELQKQYKDKLTVIGVNVWENYDEIDAEGIAKFVEKQADRMSYSVAYDGKPGKTDQAYMKAALQRGIPAAFLVDTTGKIAFIGHPMEIDSVLPDVLAGTFDPAKHAEKQKALKGKQGEFTKAANAKEFDKALTILDDLQKLDPKNASLLSVTRFGMLLTGKKDYAAAYGMKTALLADPKISKDAQMLNQIAWMVIDPEGQVPADKRDNDFALAVATKAAEASEFKDAAILDTYAYALFNKGEKAKAVEWQTKAVELAEQPEMKEELQKNLEKFKK